ncbi:MAG: spore coat protein CotJB [Anaeroplasma sp.]
MINIKTLEINSQQFIMNNDIEKGFLRGSIWENLFEPYKYVLDKITPMNEKEMLVYTLQIYTFAALDLKLFIITHPDNKEAKNTYKNIEIECKKIREYIDNKYSLDSLEGYA